MASQALGRIVGRQVAGDLERPVAGLERHQLARRARQRLRRGRRPPRRPRCAARRCGRRRPRRPPSASPTSRSPCPSPSWTSCSSRSTGSVRATPSLTVVSSRPCSPASARTARSHCWPSYHQWPEQLGVEREAQQPGPAPVGGVGVQPLDAAGDEVARVRARLLGRVRASVRAAADVPRAQVVGGAVVVVAVAGGGGVAGQPVPHQLDGLPVDRHRHHAGGGQHRLELFGRAEAVHRRLVDAGDGDPHVGQLALQPGRVRALGQPQPAPERAEAALVGRGAGGQLEPHARVAGQQRQQRVGGGRGPQLHRGVALDPRRARRPDRGPRPVAARPARGRRRRGAPRPPARAGRSGPGRPSPARAPPRAVPPGTRSADRRPGRAASPAGRPAPASRPASAAPAPRPAGPAAGGRPRRSPPTATPRRTARCRSPRRRACASAARARASRGRGSSQDGHEVQRAVQVAAPQREVATRRSRA